MSKPLVFPHTIGVRLTDDDVEKLERLAHATQRAPSEVLRVLLRMAQARDVPAVELTGIGRNDDREGVETATPSQP